MSEGSGYKRLSLDGAVYEYVRQGTTFGLGQSEIVTRKIAQDGVAVDDISEYTFSQKFWHEMQVVPKDFLGRREPTVDSYITVKLPNDITHGDLLEAAGSVMEASAQFVDWEDLYNDVNDSISKPGRILLAIMHQLVSGDIVGVER
jgi:hypothetical protein